MRYMGSKAKYVKHIMPILMDGHDSSKPYVEPFVGGGNMICECPAPIRWGNDLAGYAVALLEALGDGWNPPEELSEETYRDVKSNSDSYPNHLVGFAMYSCSYAGKAWGGYARGNDSKGFPRNFAAEQARNLRKQAVGLKNIMWTTLNYKDMQIEPGSTVYCDPPYSGATGYKVGFNHQEFWRWCDTLV